MKESHEYDYSRVNDPHEYEYLIVKEFDRNIQGRWGFRFLVLADRILQI